jgi:hypothetical protein
VRRLWLRSSRRTSVAGPPGSRLRGGPTRTYTPSTLASRSSSATPCMTASFPAIPAPAERRRAQGSSGRTSQPRNRSGLCTTPYLLVSDPRSCSALTPGCSLPRRSTTPRGRRLHPRSRLPGDPVAKRATKVGHQQDAHPDPERTLPGALRRRRAGEKADPCHCRGRRSHRRTLGH